MHGFETESTHMSQTSDAVKTGMSRRQLIQWAAGVAAVGLAETAAGRADAAAVPQTASTQEKTVVVNGRIKQSMAYWCFNSAGDKWNGAMPTT